MLKLLEKALHLEIQSALHERLCFFLLERLDNERPASLLGGDETSVIQQPVGARDGIEVDPQLRGHLPHGRKLIPWFQIPAGQCVAHLVNDLDVSGHV